VEVCPCCVVERHEDVHTRAVRFAGNSYFREYLLYIHSIFYNISMSTLFVNLFYQFYVVNRMLDP
jgi:hypothetical protein